VTRFPSVPLQTSVAGVVGSWPLWLSGTVVFVAFVGCLYCCFVTLRKRVRSMLGSIDDCSPLIWQSPHAVISSCAAACTVLFSEGTGVGPRAVRDTIPVGRTARPARRHQLQSPAGGPHGGGKRGGGKRGGGKRGGGKRGAAASQAWLCDRAAWLQRGRPRCPRPPRAERSGQRGRRD